MSNLRKALDNLEEVCPHFHFPGDQELLDESIKALRTELAQREQEPTQEIYAVLFAVEEAVRNGCAPWDIEAAFEKYEAKLKEIK